MYKFKGKCIIIIATVILLLTSTVSLATENNIIETNNTTTTSVKKDITSEQNLTQESTSSKIVQIRDDQLKTIEDYKAKYGSDTYGLIAYILHVIQWWSIPLGLVFLAISAIFQYVIGLKRLDLRDKGFNSMIALVTIIIICQVLPLIFAIVVKSND